MSYSILVTLFTLLLLPGIVGVVIPVLPGIPYMFGITLIFAFLDKFSHLTQVEIGYLVIILLLSFVVDYSSGIIGAKFGGASKSSQLYGILGAVLGLIILPPFGAILGLFLGILFGEWRNGKSHTLAFRAAGSSLIGSLTGTAVNLIFAIIYLGLFIVFALH